MGRTKWNIQKINEILLEQNQGYMCLSTEYKNVHEKLIFICPKGHKFSMAFNDFRRGQRCPKCALEKKNKDKRTPFDEIKREYSKYGCELISTENEYINNKSRLKFICKCGRKHTSSFNGFKQSHQCKMCGKEKTKGENHYAYRGGITPIHEYLRRHIYQWKIDSFRNSNNKCIITGKGSKKIVHHLQVNFSDILIEVLNNTNIQIYDEINLYASEQLLFLEKECLRLHYKYGIGVVIHEKIHKLFHNIYKYGDNTPEQFKEFVTRLEQGEFDDFLKENNLTLNINYEVLNKLLN